MNITIRSVRATERNIALRLPFSYGDVTLTSLSEAQLEVEIETEFGRHTGQAAQVLAPRWFNKSPGLSLPGSVEELRTSVLRTMGDAFGASGTPAQLSKGLRESVVQSLSEMAIPPLAAGFGPALLEAALIDASCRAVGLSFADALRADIFQLAGSASPDLGADAMGAFLKDVSCPWSLELRHTVGYHSPLVESDVSAPVCDGLPQSLEGAIEVEGLRLFKVKLKGHLEEDLVWLKSVGELLSRRVPEFRLTLDANEQYEQDSLAQLIDHLDHNPAYINIRNGLLFIEQPFSRDMALSAGLILPSTNIPFVIDESDDSENALLAAFELGWSGTSAKSCKGVFHSLINAARVARRRADGKSAIISAEDLSCQAYLGLQQDCLMAMCMGARHVEKNGHQFGGALQGYDSRVAAKILEEHPDLYRNHHGRPLLRVSGGKISFASLDYPGFGSKAGISLVGKEI